MENLIELWTELVQDSEELNNSSAASSVFNECLESAASIHFWDGAKDESLRSILSIINRLMNETRTSGKGLSLMNCFIRHVPPSRFVVVQDALTSALHLIVKNLDSELAKQLLTQFLPHCQKLPDLNQVITTTVVSKILSNFCEETRNSTVPSVEGIALLRVCLQKYHGPCGNFRTNLEKALIPLIDHDFKGTALQLVLRTIPLLSGAGGGGSKGDKHSQDWSQMVGKILSATNQCASSLFRDACALLEDQNPYQTEGNTLNLPDIRVENVYIRFTLVKRRLVNLMNLLGFYLLDSFPTAKPVPYKGILHVIMSSVMLNPVDMLRNIGNSPRREFIYLASILPAVHEAAFKLLGNLLSCVGVNILPEAVRVEQLFSQEFKWIFEKRNSFEAVKLEMYGTLLCWLKLTRSSVTTAKTVTGWIGFFKKDIEIQKETVELNLMSKSKKRGQTKVSSTQTISSGFGAGIVVSKHSGICRLALELLTVLVSTADAASHQALYKQVGILVAEFVQSSKYPSPYDHPFCRINAFKCLASLATNPHPASPVSVGLIISLMMQGRTDPISSVITVSDQLTSLLERLIHPICPSLDFRNSSFAALSHLPEEIPELPTTEVDSLVSPVETTESFCQTDIPEETDTASGDLLNSSRNQSIMELDEIKETITQTIQHSLDKLLLRHQVQLRNVHSMEETSDNESSDERLTRPPPMQSSPFTTALNGFGDNSSKRKAQDELISSSEHQHVPLKFAKTAESDDNYLELLKDFANVGPDK